MKTVGVAELKSRLSLFLREVKNGQEVVITERGRPVAKLVPLRTAERRVSRREQLVGAGLLQPGAGRVRDALRRAARGPRLGDGVLKALLAERAEGR